MEVRELLEQLGVTTPDPTPEGECSIKCFHHDDHANSCSLNVYSGLWVCHTSGVGGDIVKAVHFITGKSMDEARAYVNFMDVRTWDPKGTGSGATPKVDKVIDEGILSVYVKNLFANKSARSKAITQFGWTDETMKLEEIGWDERTQRYTFPIRNEEGALVNFRLYDPTAKDASNKVISWTDTGGKAGYGTVRLYPVEALKKQTIILVEGEKDRTLMSQVLRDNKANTFGSITHTGGAGTWKEAWNESFRDKHLIIIYDRDKAGQDGAQRIASGLTLICSSVKVVTLDIEDKSGDITDYFVKHGRSWDDLQKLIEGTDYFTVMTKREKPVGVIDDTVYKPHLAEASQDRFMFKKLQMAVMVAGKDLAPYAIPAKVTFDCYFNQGAMCAGCSNFSNSGLQIVELDKNDTDIVKLVKVPEDQQMNLLKRRKGINTRCKAVEATVDEYHNVEEVNLIPEIDFSIEAEKEYVSRVGYAMQHGILPNKSYIVDGTSVPHPKTGHVVHFLHKVTNAQDSIEDFQIDETKIERLKIFQPSEGQSIDEKFDEIAKDLTLNITRIWGREDIIKAVDLVYHTVLAFKFQDKAVAKAWGECAIIGDTRTGKSETVQAQINHYKMGEMAMGENTSFAGLIGGLRQESGGRWILNWGRIPLNDRRLLAIDESSGLSLDTIGAMSGIRSNGIAEIMKVTGMQRTLARTRMIWISNPRSTRSLGDYSHGVEVLRELIGRPEDIARFDFVVSAATNEVPIGTINAAEHEHVDHTYTSELCRMLILWAWSRKSDDIVFTKEAVTAVLDLATDQSERYSSEGGIPLVEAGNHRIKIAKLAVAAACRTFSTEDGKSVIVKPAHAEFAADFLDAVYEKPSLDYAGFSQALLARTNVTDATKDLVRAWIKNQVDVADLWRIHPSLRIDDFKNIFDLESKDVKSDIIKPLSKWRMIEKTRQSDFRKTPVFIGLLKEARDKGVFDASANGSSGGVDPEFDPDASDDVPF